MAKRMGIMRMSAKGKAELHAARTSAFGREMAKRGWVAVLDPGGSYFEKTVGNKTMLMSTLTPGTMDDFNFPTKMTDKAFVGFYKDSGPTRHIGKYTVAEFLAKYDK